jgi:outer membrane protein assembly factor BamB
MARAVVLFVIAIALMALLPASSSSAGFSPEHTVSGTQQFQAPRSAEYSGIPPAVSWPTYLFDPERNGANLAERTIAPTNVSQLEELWTLPSNGSDFSAPIVVNNTLYYGSWNGYEYAVNTSTGYVDWGIYLGTDPLCGGYQPMGISSTPAYSDGTLYLGGGNGTWYALNAATGQIEWSYYVGTPPAVNNYDWASALVYRNSLYIGVASCFDNPLIQGALIQVNLTGSHTANHTFYTVPAGQTGNSIWTTPALDPANNTIWVATGNENTGYPIYANAIIALNASTLVPLGSWQVPDVAGEDSDFGSTPTLFQTANGTPMIVATNKNGVAYALNRSNVTTPGWSPVWSLDTGGGFSSGAFEGGILYLAGNGLYAVDPNNGTVIWDNSAVTGVFSALTWANGLVYAGTGNSIYAVDAENGTTMWNVTTEGGGDIVDESVVDDGQLYVPSGNYGTEGNLTAYGIPFTGSASESPLQGLTSTQFQFHANAQGGLTPYTFQWSFGDGTSGTGALSAHSYAAGNYTARVWINDSSGGSIVRTFPLHVIAALTASISVIYLYATFSCDGTLTNTPQVQLTADTGGGELPITDHWTFSTGGTSTGPVVTLTFTKPFVANLSASDTSGQTANVSETVGGPSAMPHPCPPVISPLWTWVAVAGILAVVLLAVVLVLAIRRRRRREQPPVPPTPPL